MTDEELNKWLHENVMGRCWHDSEPEQPPFSGWTKCTKCKVWRGPNPNYCNSLDAVARVEEELIKEGTSVELAERIAEFAGCEPFARAGHIARACKETFEARMIMHLRAVREAFVSGDERVTAQVYGHDVTYEVRRLLDRERYCISCSAETDQAFYIGPKRMALCRSCKEAWESR